MKYMGSKAALLLGPLGDLVLAEAARADRFVDLFSGSGSVGNAVAEQVDVPVLSADLQKYSQILSAAIIERTVPLDESEEISAWLQRSQTALRSDEAFARVEALPEKLSKQDVMSARTASIEASSSGFITMHYGGHYFSRAQALALDHLFRSMPERAPIRTLAYAVLLKAASVCAAAPGHTAQPFQPTATLLPFIQKAWSRDVFAEVRRGVDTMGRRHARVAGHALVSDAHDLAETLDGGDVVFCDPPYSSVQYSRFYHVLEGIARGGWDQVSGAGRAPSLEDRSSSAFSLRRSATESFGELLATLRDRECQVIITFPDAEASNGMSSSAIVGMAADSWHVTTTLVDSTHSTLGGRTDDGGRGGRRKLKEAVIVLRPRATVVTFTAGVDTCAPPASDGVADAERAAS